MGTNQVVAAATAVAWMLAGASVAQADTTVTANFAATRAEQTFTVPAGVHTSMSC